MKTVKTRPSTSDENVAVNLKISSDENGNTAVDHKATSDENVAVKLKISSGENSKNSKNAAVDLKVSSSKTVAKERVISKFDEKNALCPSANQFE